MRSNDLRLWSIGLNLAVRARQVRMTCDFGRSRGSNSASFQVCSYFSGDQNVTNQIQKSVDRDDSDLRNCGRISIRSRDSSARWAWRARTRSWFRRTSISGTSPRWTWRRIPSTRADAVSSSRAEPRQSRRQSPACTYAISSTSTDPRRSRRISSTRADPLPSARAIAWRTRWWICWRRSLRVSGWASAWSRIFVRT